MRSIKKISKKFQTQTQTQIPQKNWVQTQTQTQIPKKIGSRPKLRPKFSMNFEKNWKNLTVFGTFLRPLLMGLLFCQ